jgi:hypothetical protein
MSHGLVGWRTSSCSGQGFDCVEVAVKDEFVEVRDSKDRNGPALIFTRRQWEAFLRSLHG